MEKEKYLNLEKAIQEDCLKQKEEKAKTDININMGGLIFFFLICCLIIKLIFFVWK